MVNRNIALIIASVLFLILGTNTKAQFSLQQAYPSLTFSSPVDLQYAPDGTDRVFVVEQSGVIRVFENNKNTTTTKVFLDITDRVTSGGETGLLGLAFHPDFANNGYFYVDYTTPNPLRTHILRFLIQRIRTVNRYLLKLHSHIRITMAEELSSVLTDTCTSVLVTAVPVETQTIMVRTARFFLEKF
jgi:Glucose / Sorbosone dehydrogenase